MWEHRRSTDKRYPGDNRLIFPKSPYRRDGLAPRCRLVASWGWSRSQGLGCSPIKAARELGSERRITASPGSNSRMHTGYIGETRPALYRTGRGQYQGKTSNHAGFNPRLHLRDSSMATEVCTSNSFDEATTSTVIRSAQAYVFTRAHSVKRDWNGSKSSQVAATFATQLVQ